MNMGNLSTRIAACDAAASNGYQVQSNPIYHEKQVKELCAMHAMNNLLQEKLFTQEDMDNICEELSPTSYRMLNPHRSFLGTGNYDVNVIMVALKSKQYEVLWFDRRRQLADLKFAQIKGFILNIPSTYMLAGLIPMKLMRNHWLSLCKIEEQYYNLDSKLKKPLLIGSEEDLRLFLNKHLQDRSSELLLVVKEEVDKSSLWTSAENNC